MFEYHCGFLWFPKKGLLVSTSSVGNEAATMKHWLINGMNNSINIRIQCQALVIKMNSVSKAVLSICT